MMHWMVRQNSFSFLRPMSASDLVRKIESGELSADDEICSHAGFWFSLREANEVRSQLGNVNLSLIYGQKNKGDDTQTSATNDFGPTIAIEQEPKKVVKEEVDLRVGQVLQPKVVLQQKPVPPKAQSSPMQEPVEISKAKAIGFVSILFLGFFLSLAYFWLTAH